MHFSFLIDDIHSKKDFPKDSFDQSGDYIDNSDMQKAKEYHNPCEIIRCPPAMIKCNL